MAYEIILGPLSSFYGSVDKFKKCQSCRLLSKESAAAMAGCSHVLQSELQREQMLYCRITRLDTITRQMKKIATSHWRSGDGIPLVKLGSESQMESIFYAGVEVEVAKNSQKFRGPAHGCSDNMACIRLMSCRVKHQTSSVQNSGNDLEKSLKKNDSSVPT